MNKQWVSVSGCGGGGGPDDCPYDRSYCVGCCWWGAASVEGGLTTAIRDVKIPLHPG